MTAKPGPEAPRIVPVVLSGGSGTRLWPLSRESYPKQFLPLLGPHSLLQETLLRVADRARFAAPIVVCNNDHRFLAAEQLRALGLADARIVLEPMGRNTAAAVAAAALLLARHDRSAVMWIMPADHHVADLPALHAALAAAANAAVAGLLATFGIRPARPETGYGYIELGDALPSIPGAHGVARFIEKPDAERACAFLAGGRHLWNSGMFLFQVGALLDEMTNHAPEVVAAVEKALDGAETDLDFLRLGASGFAQAPSISIDYAVMERTARAAVVPCDIGWSDVGSWATLWEVGAKDKDGNVTDGNVLLSGSRDCYVRSTDRIVTTVVGAQDLVVVTTDDAVMVAPRERAQDVRQIVEMLRTSKRPEAVLHRRVYRPWGFYESLHDGNRYQVKRITVNPGAKLSLQKHFHRAEHWVVVNGTATVERDGETILLRENESVYLPLGCVHRLENPGRIPLNLIEVQSGAYLGEDDIVRFEDSYGRD
ncbi:MAG: mannose-1-phosphate guanylyltransferase/mannose-6-phosphate isomerase [Alphaproteobacteria bacterium]|nr:mannose-1-phosphate guanylyltransferase/mannose-6-phosphate isomerase [Alphaproteobacteria bacterium]